MEPHNELPVKEIEINRPTGPRFTITEPVSMGQLVISKASKTAKNIATTAVVGVSAALAVLTRHKFATGIGISTITAVATHFLIASMMMGMVGDKKPTVTASYQGFGDLGVSNVKAYWGFRCYTAAYTGNVADIADSSTGNTTGTRLQCDGAGNVVALVSGSACTFVTGNACSSLAVTCAVACEVAEAYDQSGANNCSGACNVGRAHPNRATLTQSCQNGRPCMVCSTSKYLDSNGFAAGTFTGITNTTTHFTILTVGQRTSTTTFNAIIAFGGTGTVQQGLGDTSGNAFIFANGSVLQQSATEGNLHALQGMYNGASSKIQVDGAAPTTGNPGSADIGTDFFGICEITGNGGNPFTGNFMEAAVMSGDQSGSFNTINTNVHSTSGWNF